MRDSSKTDRELIAENAALKQRIQNLEQSNAERTRTEQRLAYILAAVESASEAIGISDAQGHHVYQNKALSALFGYATAEDLDAAGGGPAVVKDPAVARAMFDNILHGRSWVGELEMVTKSGRVFTAFEHADAILDGEGHVIGVTGIITDITERKRTEEALRKSDTLLKEAQRVGQFGSWNWDAVTDTITWSDEYYRIYGLDPKRRPPGYEEHLKLYTSESAARLDAAVKHSMQTGEAYRLDLELARGDGSPGWVIARGEAKHDPNGRIVGLCGTAQNITERKQAEETLRNSEEEFRSLAEAMPQIVWVARPDGWNSYCNQQWVDYTGLTLEESCGHGWNIPFHPDDRQRAWDAWQNATRTGGTYSLECRLRRADGVYRWWLIRGVPVLDKAGEILKWFGTCTDIDDIKRTEEEKARLEAQLQQAEKMESVGRLAGGVAHDFNSMLEVILGNVELALEQVDPAQPLYADLTEIRTAATRSANLTQQLLGFARKQMVVPRVLDLNDTVADMLKMLRRLIGENIDLTWQPKADLWPVKVDPSQIDQILANLCLNARDAISGVGTVTIETGHSTLDARYCAAHPECDPGEYVRLIVSDTGCGMDEGTLSHLFEPFFTTKAFGESSGLGLASVHGAVKQNGGFVEVASTPGQGTTFTIYLPRHGGKAGETGTEDTARLVLRGHETILLVEDEPAILTLAKRMLERQGYTVLAASTPGEALRLAKTHPGEIHLLMTDVVMPEMNGRALAKHLLSLYPHIKCLFMSGYTADVIADHGVVDDGVSFIQKPFSATALSARLRETLDRD